MAKVKPVISPLVVNYLAMVIDGMRADIDAAKSRGEDPASVDAAEVVRSLVVGTASILVCIRQEHPTPPQPAMMAMALLDVYVREVASGVEKRRQAAADSAQLKVSEECRVKLWDQLAPTIQRAVDAAQKEEDDGK